MLTLGGAHLASAADQVVSDCGDSGLQTQLRFQLELAQERDYSTISFTCAPTVTLTGGVLPSINLTVTIDGGNTITLSGNNASRLFDVAGGGNLTLQDITLTKGYADGDGGAIYSYGTLNINNSHFLDNQTTLNGNGGAIVSFGTLNISNSEFAYNKAANGGALYPTGAAAVTTITGSNFHHNQTTSPTNGWGGAIYMSAGADVTVTASRLSTNQARFGGAVYVYQTSNGLLTVLTIVNSTLNGNSATQNGGGILNSSGTATLTNVTLSGNSSGGFGVGGGIFNGGTATLTLTNVTISGNSAGGGGGIDIGEQATATLTNATLSSNQAGTSGGGIVNGGTLTLTNVSLYSNQAGANGGGLHNYAGLATLTNVTLSGNQAAAGGGIFNWDTVTLTNVTLSGNEAPDGGGIVNPGTASLKNTLIAKGAQGVNCAGISGGSFNLSDDTSCGFGAGRDNVNLLLGPLANNGGLTLTHMPQPPSPAIDGGTGSGCPAIDQRGASRPQGLACDVGAVEYGAILPWLYLPLVRR